MIITFSANMELANGRSDVSKKEEDCDRYVEQLSHYSCFNFKVVSPVRTGCSNIMVRIVQSSLCGSPLYGFSWNPWLCSVMAILQSDYDQQPQQFSKKQHLKEHTPTGYTAPGASKLPEARVHWARVLALRPKSVDRNTRHGTAAAREHEEKPSIETSKSRRRYSTRPRDQEGNLNVSRPRRMHQ